MWTNPRFLPLRVYARISVRVLMLLVLVAGCWLGWLVRTMRTQRSGGRDPAVRRIRRIRVGHLEPQSQAGRRSVVAEGAGRSPRGRLLLQCRCRGSRRSGHRSGSCPRGATDAASISAIIAVPGDRRRARIPARSHQPQASDASLHPCHGRRIVVSEEVLTTSKRSASPAQAAAMPDWHT